MIGFILKNNRRRGVKGLAKIYLLILRAKFKIANSLGRQEKFSDKERVGLKNKVREEWGKLRADKVMESIRELKKEMRVYIYGGFIRDIYEGKKADDIDLVLVDKEIFKFKKKIGEILRKEGKVRDEYWLESVGYRYGVIRWENRRGEKFDWMLAEGLDQLFVTADFNIHLILFDLNKGVWFDPFFGLESLQKKEAKAIFNPEERLAVFEDSLRALLVHFKHGMKLEEKYWQAIRRNKQRLPRVIKQSIKNSQSRLNYKNLRFIDQSYRAKPKELVKCLADLGIERELIRKARKEWRRVNKNRN